MFNTLRTIDLWIEKVSTFLLVLFVLAMLFMSSLSIMARWFQINLSWVDPFVRHLVFLCAFLGGVIATGRGTHIGIDVIGKLFEAKNMKRVSRVISIFTTLASILVLFWLISAGIDFTKVEMEYSKPEFWGIGSGYLVMLIPIGLSLLVLRFITVFLLSFDSDFKVSQNQMKEQN